MHCSRIKRVHIKDFRHEFDWNGKYSFCELGEGDVPWEETMQSLRALGYDETIVNERHQGSEPSSGPGWSSILTGAWADKHGVDGNSFRKPRLNIFPHYRSWGPGYQP